MCSSAKEIYEAYLELGRQEDAEKWFSKVMKDADELIEGVVSGADRVQLMAFRMVFEIVVKGGEPDPDELRIMVEDAERYLEDYLAREGLEPADRWASSYKLAEAYQESGRYDEALTLLEGLSVDADDSFSEETVTRALERLKGQRAVSALPPEHQSQIEESQRNLNTLHAALFRYAEDHGKTFPARLGELVEGGYVKDAGILNDPFAGQPYEYVPGLTLRNSPNTELIRTPIKDGIWQYRTVGGSGGVGLGQ
jgi:tetratricopeptide (TPR) repeat protein